ncbi:MAG: hypothetical protein UY17_C0009G0004 [Candidatus Beckwithbacteria bacterium GW2011_GWC2_47_9]|uniref:Uncharacterized protein n=1 Tax=Candidatus Beckwithbacteria bacterium GW2011_GWC2_47_9 TaxID=1618373 RepID=A0A0G1U114_9BACT|nr:MAG: hypothetical protein UY17_C0009G0004 [Candidatus Beckwithbacteria bacterium GW2011_GWC2_47_9]
MKPVWRVVTFVFTLLFIYLLFPILIVPSSLPAIQEMVTGQADAQIFQLEIEREPTLKDKIRVLRRLHRQGIAIILKR